MASTNKRSFSSIEEYANVVSDEPVTKRPKAAIGKSASRKRRNDETSLNEPIQKGLRDAEPESEENSRESEISTSFVSDDSGFIDGVSVEEAVAPNESELQTSTNESVPLNETQNDSNSLQEPSTPYSSQNNAIINANRFCNSKVQKVFMKMVRKRNDTTNVCKKCKPTSRCGQGSKCENAGSNQECPRACKNETGGCKNRLISEKRGLKTGKEIEIVDTGNKGFGIRAMVDIQMGTYIGEYNGEIIDELEKERRDTQRKNGSAFYVMKLGKFFIDGEHFGSNMRYINHSCAPNCETQEYLSADGTPHNVIFAIENISAGKELSFNYSEYHGENETEFTCYCKAKNCTGVFYA